MKRKRQPKHIWKNHLTPILLAVILLFLGGYGVIRVWKHQGQTASPALSSPQAEKQKPSPAGAEEAAAQPDGREKAPLRESAQTPGFLDGWVVPGTDAAELPAEDAFTLYDQATGKTFSLSGRELLPGALACEMDLSAPEEALKAQAVACYTLFSRKRAKGEVIVCDTEQWQVWVSREVMERRWREDVDNYMGILNSAVDQVYGQVLEYEGEPILAAYCAISAGATELSGNVWQTDLPYLQAAASPGDLLCDGYASTVVFSVKEFKEAAAACFPEKDWELSGDPRTWLTDLERSPSGYVVSAKLGGKTVTGPQLRAAFSLRSASFTVDLSKNKFTFHVRGWGHGVGMSQAGAEFLAKRGAGYRDILSHYYPGTTLTFP